ncbi:MAG: MauM/NapG family ferredoxin-type protein [Burkholderiales bacterium]
MTSALALGGMTLALATQVGSERRRALPADRIRPPGALREADFLDACVRCGLCVQACPYDTLHLAGLGQPVPVGTPYFVARETPCYMCETIPCAAACPTGALKLTDIGAADMGLAKLSAPDRCFSYTGVAYCDSCFQACPIKGKAIRMQHGRTPRGGSFQPVVDVDSCTGCGKCEAACILQGDAAITVSANHATRR